MSSMKVYFIKDELSDNVPQSELSINCNHANIHNIFIFEDAEGQVVKLTLKQAKVLSGFIQNNIEDAS